MQYSLRELERKDFIDITHGEMILNLVSYTV